MPGYGDCSATVQQATADIESKLDVKFVAVTSQRAIDQKIVNGKGVMMNVVH